jgi:hypothetical protein
LFAIGRELEYLGNTTDAALIYSNLNTVLAEEYDYEYSQQVYWNNRHNLNLGFFPFYTNYFEYINFEYSPKQVTALIDRIQLMNCKDKFHQWEIQYASKDLNLLYDLLGTMNMRLNKLPEALAAFKKVEDSFWKKQYGVWEYEDYSSGNIFDQNPFYQLKYTPVFIPMNDTFKVNKETVVQYLINYQHLAKAAKKRDKSYYYFLVANCYYNMTNHGNSWMMKRYAWSSSNFESELPDEHEYYEANIAKENYKLAMQNSSSKKFKALCLRMIGKCEMHAIEYSLRNQDLYYNSSYDSLIFSKNRYYNDLKKMGDNIYTDMMSDCSSYADYFAAR